MGSEWEKMKALSKKMIYIMTDTQQKLFEIENQIEQKEIELQELEEFVEKRKVASMICTELPRDMQREIVNKLVSMEPDFALYICINNDECKWPSNYSISITHSFLRFSHMGFTIDSVIFKYEHLIGIIHSMKSIYQDYENLHADRTSFVCGAGIVLRKDCLEIHEILKMPRKTGINFIQSYKYLQKHEFEISKERLMYVYANDDMTIESVPDEFKHYKDVIKIVL